MKLKSILSATVLAGLALTSFVSCDTEVENETIQHLYKYDAQYFENLRAWKKTQHEVTYVYYAAWAPLEGQEGYKDPASWGERIKGLPDSLDIVNLWMGIPTPETHPVAYEDMVYAQDVLGTRFVFHGDASHFNHYFYDREFDEITKSFKYKLDANGNKVVLKSDPNDEYSLRSYARWACDTVMKCRLDGVDFDYEGWDNESMRIVADECNKFFGPEGAWPEKLFIIDWFGGAPSGCDDYCDYFVRQAYTWQIGFQTGTGGRPQEKTIYCDSFGGEAGEAGPRGAQICDYARWEPATGHKGGCGAYYVDFNYKDPSGIPYGEFRKAIQIMNPAIHK